MAGLTVNASNTVVKGLVINRFAHTDAIAIQPSRLQDIVTNVRIEGNFIGTDPSGTIDLGNRSGVSIFRSSENTVGGTSLASRNLISGNEFSGVFVYADFTSGFVPATGNRVEGNLIGPERDGISSMGNGAVGVGVGGEAATGNRILSNVGLGIDVDVNGITPNDPDVGPNNLQNFPVLSSARTSRKGTTIKATLESRPGASYTIQVFSNPPGTDGGARFIGQRSVSVDASGDASFSFKPK